MYILFVKNITAEYTLLLLLQFFLLNTLFVPLLLLLLSDLDLDF